MTAHTVLTVTTPTTLTTTHTPTTPPRRSISFARGIPPVAAIPAVQLREHTVAVLDELGPDAFQYAPIGRYLGHPDLRAELAAEHGVDPDSVLVTTGSLQALDLVAGLLVPGPGAVVLVEGPTYDRAAAIFERHGARLVSVPVASDGIDVEALRRVLAVERPAVLYTIPDFQNPSGVTASPAVRRELLDLAARHAVTVVEDVPYRELRFAGVAPAGLWQQAGDARVVTIGSLSKVLSPGLRIGYVLSDPDTARALAARAEAVTLSPVPLCQAVAARALGAGLLRTSVARVRELLRPKHDAAVAVTEGLLGDALMAVPNGGYYLGLRLAVDRSEPQFLAAAKARGVVLLPGSTFFPSTERSRLDQLFLRLPFQSLEPAEFAAGIEVLARLARRS